MVREITCDKATTELSSLLASSTTSLLGRSLRRRIAVAKSSGLKSSKKDHESLTQIGFIKRLALMGTNVILIGDRKVNQTEPLSSPPDKIVDDENEALATLFLFIVIARVYV